MKLRYILLVAISAFLLLLSACSVENTAFLAAPTMTGNLIASPSDDLPDTELPNPTVTFVPEVTPTLENTPEGNQLPITTPAPTPHVHTEKTLERIEPTCISIGFTEGVVCEDCKEVIIAQEELPLSDHVFSENYRCIVCSILDATEGLEFTLLDDGTYAVANIGRAEGISTLIIPVEYDGINVTAIGDNAFEGNDSIKQVILQEPIVKIGNNAFTNCFSLTEIVLPSSLVCIGSYAFMACSALESIELPDGISSIGDHAFVACSSLGVVNIPDGLSEIQDGMFTDCMSIKNITLPDNIKRIGIEAFTRCGTLESVNIIGAATIGEGAFSMCSSLLTVALPKTLTLIEAEAFSDCTSLTSISYKGDVEEWNAVTKVQWDTGASEYTVYCKNGNVKKH